MYFELEQHVNDWPKSITRSQSYQKCFLINAYLLVKVSTFLQKLQMFKLKCNIRKTSKIEVWKNGLLLVIFRELLSNV